MILVRRKGRAVSVFFAASKHYLRFLFVLISFLALFQPAHAQISRKFASLLGKEAVLELTDGERVVGKIVQIKKDGVVFDPQKVSLFYDPPPKFYPFSKIKKLVRKNGHVVCQRSSAPHQKRFSYAVSLLGSRYKTENSTYAPILLEAKAVSKRLEVTAAFAKSFNLDEGVGCCECWEEIPPRPYWVPYSTYLWRLEGKGSFSRGGFAVGFAGFYQENGWCADRSAYGLPFIPYAGFWGRPVGHFSVGLKFLIVPYGALTSGVAWQSTDHLSSVWVGVIYFGERLPRLSGLRPSFRVQLQVRKKWLLHLRLYQVNLFHASAAPRFFLIGAGWIFQPKQIGRERNK